MKTQRTVLEWLNMLPEEFEGKPLRKMALDNCNRNKDKMADKSWFAIADSCVWSNTPEKHLYWESIYDKLVSGEIKLIEPTDQEQAKLDAIKDKVAYQEYGIPFAFIPTEQEGALIDKIAIEYHRQMSEPKQDNDLLIIIKLDE